jgi:hypothetical protein
VEEFVACFAEVVDPRQDNARHDLHELLMIALCTLLSGGEDCSDMALFGEIKAPYLRQFLRLRHGTPSHDTFSRVFRLLDPKAFETCFTRFMQRFAESLQGVVAVDGKTLRRSFDRATGKSPRVRPVVACLGLRNEGARVIESGAVRRSIQGPHRGAATATGERGH